jgi:F-type H+-transporting ATPase subunit a
MAAGQQHFTWMHAIPGVNQLPDHTATALLVAAGLLGTAYVARRQLAAAPDPVVPDSGFTARNIMEVFVEGFTGVVENVVGPEGRKYAPLYGAFFIFILCSNLIGLIPGFSPPTGNVNTTLGLGLTSFVMFNYYGFQKQGGSYLKHFAGPIIWLAPLMIPLELISVMVRPVTLNLRLLINMFADHLVLDIFTDLLKIIVPVAFYLLGFLVCVIQAAVFTMLSLVYVALATAGHDDHGEHAHGEHGADAHAAPVAAPH